MPLAGQTTYSSSTPVALLEPYIVGAAPTVFYAGSTAVSAAIIATGFWSACGYGSRSGVGMRVGDLLLHTQLTTAGVPVKATLHAVVASTANQASTIASSGFNAAYDITVATAT